MVLNSRLSRNIYRFGQKLQLKCNEGYELKGEPFIQCLATGKWSRSTSDCSSNNFFFFFTHTVHDLFITKCVFISGVSCQKPDLPSNAAITGSGSYLYLEKLLIKCANNVSFEIQCNVDGKWSKSPKDVC